MGGPCRRWPRPPRNIRPSPGISCVCAGSWRVDSTTPIDKQLAQALADLEAFEMPPRRDDTPSRPPWPKGYLVTPLTKCGAAPLNPISVGKMTFLVVLLIIISPVRFSLAMDA